MLDLLRERLGHADSFHFERARRMAAPKVAFMREAITQLEAELDL